ncbi:hypothetical protein GEOBRER4_n2675 [Citrifermentans bremense]|uniref:Uncharacterized protein n=1 Tax=Citrifermentans bremense TaxID=60035 RepID=A0A7R7J0A3_9BACT|nr:hypothetical protein GEOBRER4_n2675 [Citrifermentans bremense]
MSDFRSPLYYCRFVLLLKILLFTDRPRAGGRLSPPIRSAQDPELNR